MATLPEPVKLFIVQHLACYDSPQEIAHAVGVEFGLQIDRRQVEEYDPEKRAPGKKWRAVHRAAREAFEQETAREPAALRAVRIRRLARMARGAEERKNYPLAAALYEQIAKDDGGMFTNRRKLEHSGEVKTGPSLDDLTDAELAALAARLAAEQVRE